MKVFYINLNEQISTSRMEIILKNGDRNTQILI